MALPSINAILYTSSMGAHTKPVFRHAVNLATQFNAKLYYIHVIEPIGEVGRALISGYLPDDVVDRLHNEGLESLKREIKHRVDSFFQASLDKLPEELDIEVETLVEQGNYAETIIDTARELDVDLIVMGSSRHLGRSSPITKQVINAGAAPVLVVPTHK